MLRKLCMLVAAGALLAVPASFATADTVPGGGEGCIATTSAPAPGTVVYNDGCSYTSTRSGGYAGRGDYVINITFPDGTKYTVTDEDANGTSQGCAVWPAGSTVSVSVASGTVGIGNPYPSAADNLPSTTGPCYPTTPDPTEEPAA